MADMLQEALEYVRRGWYVFPCRERPGQSFTRHGEIIIPQEKTPYVAKGLNDATRDEDQIKAWWGMWKDALIGVNAGKSGLFVIDIDKKHVNGLDTYSKWDINDSAGLQSITPSGGMHIIFTGSGKSTTNAKSGIDTRGEGGYFIAPPSKIIEGEYTGEYKRYNDWSNPPGIVPDGLMAHLFPESTVEYVRGSVTPIQGDNKKKLSRITREFMSSGAIPGERNTKLFNAACDFVGCGYTMEETKGFLTPVCEKMELSNSEFEQVLKHAYDKPRTPSIPDSIQEKIMEGGKDVAGKITFEEQAIMENAVLACMMLDNASIPIIQDILYFDDFRVKKNGFIYRTITRMFMSGMKVDHLTVANEVNKETDKVTLDDVSRLTSLYFVNTDNATTYANIIKEKASIRRLEALLDNKAKYIKGSLIDSINTLEKDVADIALAGGAKSSAVLTAEQAVELVTVRTEMMDSGKIQQIKTGFSDFDYHVGGFFPFELIVCAARSGDGKCLKTGTVVIMSNGSMKKVEDISVGDNLMGIDSKPRTVLSISHGQDMLYTIKQNRAQDYTVNSNHILSLKESSNTNSSTNGKIINISIGEYIALSKKKQNNLKGYKIGVEFSKKELPIDPYFLGIWLGDGDKNSQRITSADYEIADYLFYYANDIGMNVTVGDKRGENCYTYTITGGMKSLLRSIGVLKNKHIPFDYITSCKEDRLLLLAGILDTDGNVVHNGFELIQKNKEFLKQIKWLSDSLGFRTSEIKEKICKIKSIGFSGIYYRMTIHGQMSLVPTKIARKKISYISKKIDQTLTGIEIVEDGIGEYYGFTLEGDGLFLLEDFTVTHNSAMALSLINEVSLIQGKASVLFSLEMSTHESICRLICQLTGIPFRKIFHGKLNPDEWKSYVEAKKKISDSKIYFDDGFGMTVPEIRSKVRKLVEKDIKLIVIDQLEQIKGYDGMPVYVKYDNNAYDIKNMAKEFEIPIVLNHQLNRSVTDRKLKNPEPMMSDLNQAGEKPADQVWIISHQRNEQDVITKTKIKIAKNRNGPRIDFRVIFLGDRMLFSNPEKEEDKKLFYNKTDDDYFDGDNYQDKVNKQNPSFIDD
jgi:replicative DNA helicase